MVVKLSVHYLCRGGGGGGGGGLKELGISVCSTCSYIHIR